MRPDLAAQDVPQLKLKWAFGFVGACGLRSVRKIVGDRATEVSRKALRAELSPSRWRGISHLSLRRKAGWWYQLQERTLSKPQYTLLSRKENLTLESGSRFEHPAVAALINLYTAELEADLVDNDGVVAIQQLVDDFARYVYLPRIREPGVLVQSIRGMGLFCLTWRRTPLLLPKATTRRRAAIAVTLWPDGGCVFGQHDELAGQTRTCSEAE